MTDTYRIMRAYDATGMGGPGVPQARPEGADDGWRPGAGAGGEVVQGLAHLVVGLALGLLAQDIGEWADSRVVDDLPGALVEVATFSHADAFQGGGG